MLSEVMELGALFLEQEEKTPLDVLIEPIDSNKYEHVIGIVLEKQGEKYIYKKIDLEQTGSVNSKKYLYKKGSSRGSNYSPTALVTELDKTFEIKVLDWFKNFKKKKIKLDSSLIEDIEKALIESKETILEEIKHVAADINNFVITIKISDKYLYDIPEFKDAFLALIMEKNEEISEKNKTCSVCGKQKEKIYGGASPFKFYTIDKPGFIAGGFDKDLSWRNFPVCSDCTLALDEGKRIVESKMKFWFYGLDYMLIPSFTFGNEGKEIIIDIIEEKLDKKILLNAEKESSLVTSENDILQILSYLKDNLTLHFLFMKSQQGAERILLIIDDILPSRIRRIFEAKKTVDVLFPHKMFFHLGRIRTFFAKSDVGKRENDLDKYFLEIIDAIFKGKTIDFKFLTLHYMREIRREFNNEEDNNFFYKTIDAIQSTIFLSNLKVIKSGEGSVVQTQFDSVFEKYSLRLDSNAKRGIFLLGALTKLLLNVQYDRRKSQPFLNQLKGLKMNEKDMLGLLPKVVGKLEEYESFDKGKRIVAEEIARLLLSSDTKWKLSVDEINFYFVCGMNLHDEIKQIIYPKEEE